MKSDDTDQRRASLRAWAASLTLHAIAVVLLLYGLPGSLQPQPEEQVVSVELVPPPEQPKPEPPPPPPVEADKPEPPPPPPPQPKQPEPIPQEKPAPKARIEVLKPVFQFGDKDAGPRKSVGGSAQDKAPAKNDAAMPQPDTAAASDSNVPPDKAPAPPDAAKDIPPAQEPAEEPPSVPEDAGQQPKEPEASTTTPDTQTPPPQPPDVAAGDDGEIALPATARPPEPRPAHAPRPAREPKPRGGGSQKPRSTDLAAAAPQRYSGLPGVRRLDSQGATGSAQATTATGATPRDQRVARLCASELQQQLLDASYFPDLVPLVTLKTGNVLDVPQTAFRTGGAWHALRFRCEVDSGATKVTSFTLGVGAPIPRSDWARLGLPVRN
jgi:hypothetical protein